MKTLKEINGEMVALNDQIKREQDQEKKGQLEAKFEELKREAQLAKDAEQAELVARQREALPKRAKSANQMFRELVKKAMGIAEGIELGREGDDTPAAEEPAAATLSAGVSSSVLNSGETNNMVSAGAIPTNIKELLPLLQNQLIYQRLGIQMPVGVKGDIVWPVLAAGVTVTVNEEAAEVGDSTLEFSKIAAIKKRVAVSTDITNEALDDASFDLRGVVVGNFTEALQQFLNSAVLRTTAVSDGLDGPLTVSGISTASLSATPTYAELIGMKGKVAKTNVAMKAPAFVMNSELYALLEATPKAQGQGGFIIENGKIGPYPVLECNAVANKKIAFGDFSYAALNQHGPVRLIVDPYTKKKANKIEITLNADFSLTTLRKEAFCLGTVANS